MSEMTSKGRRLAIWIMGLLGTWGGFKLFYVSFGAWGLIAFPLSLIVSFLSVAGILVFLAGPAPTHRKEGGSVTTQDTADTAKRPHGRTAT